MYQRGRIVELCTFEPSPVTGKRGVVFQIYDLPVEAIALCPLLQLNDYREEKAIERMKRRGAETVESVKLIGQPDDWAKFAGMLLADPPIYEVQAELQYKHNKSPGLKIKATRKVKQDSPITIGALVDGVRCQTGSVWVEYASHGKSLSCRLKSDSSIENEIQDQEKAIGGRFGLDLARSHLKFFQRMIVPITEEWQEMDAKRIREEQSSG